MATPLFYVDLSEDARDYRHTALEPGLPLLDRQGVNFQILRKWLGNYVAEPEWRNEHVVSFYYSEDERGRLEEVDCHTVTKAELEKQFAPDLETIRAKIKKAKAESSTESMVLRILKKNIAEQTNDLESSDFDSYFFKCRAPNEEWQLVWCCGYQRADLEPLRARIWHTPDGDFLGVRPPEGGRAKKRKRKGPLAVLTSPWVLLLLALLIGGFVYKFQPTLVVAPGEWTGPMGSRIEYKIEDHRWFFFKNDVTMRALAQANDPRVVEFEPHGAVANAKSIGETYVSFRVGSRFVDAPVRVVPPTPPDSLVIEPTDKVKVAIGSTQQMKAIGRYKDGKSVDLTTQVNWWEDGEQRLLAIKDKETTRGLIEGYSAGTTKLMARYPIPGDNETYAEASVPVEVVQAEFETITAKLEPEKFKVGQSSRIVVAGVDKKGDKHSLTGSSLLKFKVDPKSLAAVDGEYLVGKTEGAGALKISYGELDKSVDFNIKGKAIPTDLFRVQPTEVEAVVYELIPINVATGNDTPIEAVSSDSEVVDVWSTSSENVGYEVFLAARGEGEADVTVSQGGKSEVVHVMVTDTRIDRLEFDPPVMQLTVGQPDTAKVTGILADRRIIRVVPDVLKWQKQPRIENVTLNKKTLLMTPLAKTDSPQDLEARLADTPLLASGTVEVRGGTLDLAMLETEEAFGVHPPVAGGRRYLGAGGYVGDQSLLYDSDRGGLLVGHVDPFSPLGTLGDGTVITSINGRDLAGLSEADLAEYLRLHPLAAGDIIKYQGADGALLTSILGGADALGVVRDFKVLDVRTLNVAADGLNAEVQAYLRLPGEYRLATTDGKALSDWAPQPADATPVFATGAKLPRNAKDDYEVFVERRIGDEVRRFQVQFGLQAGRIETVVPRVEVDTLERAIGIPETTLQRQTVVPRTEVVRPAEGSRTVETIRKKTTRIRSGSSSSSGSSNRSSSTAPAGSDSRASNAAPGSSAPAPGSPAPGSPAPGSPAPPAPAPGQPKPSPAPASPTPAKPAPAKPTPAKPTPAKPTPAKPAPADANPDEGEEPEEGSDTASPAVPATPQGSGTRAMPQGSDTRSPNAIPADAYGSGTRAPQGSATRAGAVTGADQPVGSGTRGRTVRTAPAGSKAPKKATGATDPPRSPILDALKGYNRDWKKDGLPK